MKRSIDLKKRVFLSAVVLFILFSFPSLATKVTKQAAEASHILVGEVADAQGYYDFNKWGDYLIFSRVTVKVEKELKGRAGKYAAFSIEGGSVGDQALYVSESPAFEKGDRFKFFLKKSDGDFKFIGHEDVKPGAAKGKPSSCCKTFARWPAGTEVAYFINPESADMASGCAIGDITAGAGAWSSAVNLYLQNETGAQQAFKNGANEIFFRPDASGSTIAVTYIWYDRRTKLISEFDMIFYDGTWNFFSTTCGQTCNDGFVLEVIAAHELGHAIGLDHNRCLTSIMYPYAEYCSEDLLSADDLACAVNLYAN